MDEPTRTDSTPSNSDDDRVSDIIQQPELRPGGNKPRVTITPPPAVEQPDHAAAGADESAVDAPHPYDATIYPNNPTPADPVVAPPIPVVPAAETPVAEATSSEAPVAPAAPDAGYSQQTSILPPAAHLSALDETNSSSKRTSRLKLAGIIAGFSLLLLGGGGVLAFLFFIAPQRASLDYLQRIASLKTANFRLSYVSTIAGREGTLTATGIGDIRDKSSPKFDAELELDSTSPEFPVKLGVRLRYIDEVGYIKPTNLGLLGLIIPGLEPTSWYSIKLDGAGLGDNLSNPCSQADQEFIADYLTNRARDDLGITDVKRGGLFREKVDGVSVSRYSGVITGAGLEKIENTVNQQVSRECAGDELDDPVDYSDMRFEYTLLVGDSYDRLQVKVLRSDVEIGRVDLTTSKYDEDVAVIVPVGAEPLDDFINLNSSASGNDNLLNNSRSSNIPALQTLLPTTSKRS